MRKILVLFFILSSAVMSFAADKQLDIASLERSSSRHDLRKVEPPAVKETVEYYDIRGSSEDELRSELCRSGCKWRDGRTYDSVTNWHVTWDYDYEQSPENCSAESFKVFIDLTFRYPRWVRSDGVSRQLVEKWDAYMKSLVDHETGHRDMAVEAAAELSRIVVAMPPAPTCRELDRRIRAACHERMNRLDAEAKEYDVATGHGFAQGAVFP